MNSAQHYAGAFVLQLCPGTDVRAGRLEGRVEHLASTRGARFRTLDELLAALADLLAAEGPGWPDHIPDPEPPPGAR
jgi:hypothetical protein